MKEPRRYLSFDDPEARYYWGDGFLCGVACGIIFVVLFFWIVSLV